ncbi:MULTISPECIES: hypothetical protein [Halomicrobium]|uniref:Uncharacterized protein n=1 Tax=Halomicrobium mukohataei TaxID=57705 RepID=A0A847UIA0_9EURY|nr:MULTISPECIES: hypothetical protein [Halomicrobium]MBO4246507.1 hypothetical protein [Halomicrobium sp. IBSBa]NLV11021.1 hypothetical protein [Halomicrobium mukohataei]QGA83080.1 Uncharacterized protein LC1Hm_2044 [Halomicrobium sp. LC1Hm]
MVVATAVDTFGPFLIPATLFVVGVAGYAVLWILTGQQRKWAADDGDGVRSQDGSEPPER